MTKTSKEEALPAIATGTGEADDGTVFVYIRSCNGGCTHAMEISEAKQFARSFARSIKLAERVAARDPLICRECHGIRPCGCPVLLS